MATPTEVTRALLKNPPVSMRTLAEWAGVTHTILSRVKAGRATISVEAAARLADGLEGHSKATAEAAKGLRKALQAHPSS